MCPTALARIDRTSAGVSPAVLWRSKVESLLAGIEIEAPDALSHGSIDAFDFAGARMWLFSSEAHRLVRPFADRDRRFVPVALFQLSGETSLAQFGRDVLLRPGAFVFVDASQPLEISYNSIFCTLSVQFPWTAFPRGAFQRAAVRPADARSPMDNGFINCARSVWESADALDPRRHGAALGAMISHAMLTTAFAHAELAAPMPVRVSRAMGFIENHLGESWLNAAAVADAQQISRRHLDELFSMQGLRVETWIWQRRLNRAFEELRTFGQFDGPGRKTILQIALDAGFKSPSHFSRVFARQFGFPPSELKKRSASATLAVVDAATEN